MENFKIGFNTNLVFNETEQIDGDPRGVFLCVSNQESMKPIVKTKKGRAYAIPDYCFYLNSEKIDSLILWLQKAKGNLKK